MAVFNKRQVGYIKAIAGVGKHKTFIHKRRDVELNANGMALTTTNSRLTNISKRCTIYALPIHTSPVVVDAADQSDDASTWSMTSAKSLDVKFDGMGLLNCPMVEEKDESSLTPTTSRVGNEFFLDKTHLRLRFTMPDFQVTTGKQPHHEYRLIIFRARKAQLSNQGSNVEDFSSHLRGGASFINWYYDLFNGYVGRPVGIAGWRKRLDFDGSEKYNGRAASNGTGFTGLVGGTTLHPPGETAFTADDLMTMPLNDADYVVKTDERFFLGPEHGKSHFEKNIAFDWNQRGDWSAGDLAQGLEPGFNPLWTILIIGTSNDDVSPKLNILVRGTTSIESA